MDDNTRDRYARMFGLPSTQVKLFDELADEQREQVNDQFSLHNASSYVYAVKQDGELVWRRFKL